MSKRITHIATQPPLGALRPRSVLDLADLRDRLPEAIEIAARAAEDPAALAGSLAARRIGCLADRPVPALLAAVDAVGARLEAIAAEPSSPGADLLEEEARDLAGRSDLVALALGDHGHVAEAACAAAALVPTLGLSSDRHAPGTALSVLGVLAARLGTLAARKLVLVGPCSGLTHDLMLGGARSGLHVVLSCPYGHWPSPAIERRATELAADHGGAVDVAPGGSRALIGADAIVVEDDPRGLADAAPAALRLGRGGEDASARHRGVGEQALLRLLLA